ncbi:hypothetical protein AAVH_34042, partial [Aphelenchoides avenae]
LETALPRIDAKIQGLEAQTKLLKAILWALVTAICVVVLVFVFRSLKGAAVAWWRRDDTDRMNLLA